MAYKTNPKNIPVADKNKISNDRKAKPVAKKIANLRLILMLAVVAFIAYANTLKNDYAFDDYSVITKNKIVTKGISAIPEILSTPYRKGYFTVANDVYRPLSQVMFAVEYQLFDGAPAAGHFINILFYIGCVVLLFLFLDALFDKQKTAVAFIASLLFALHPVHTEVVANIKSRDELLCFFFSFLSLIAFLKYTQTNKITQLLVGSLLFFLALLSKETAISFLAVIPLVFFCYRKEYVRRSVFITIGSVIAAALFLAIRFSVLHAYHADNIADVKFIDNALTGAPSAAMRVATAIFILGKYLQLLFVPYPLICDYGYNTIPFVGFGNVFVLLALAAYLFMAGLGIVRLIKDRKDPYAFGVLFFLITLAIFSNLPFLIGSAMAERFLFFPSVGFCWMLALVAEKWLIKQPIAISELFKNKRLLSVMIPLLLIYMVIIIDRNGDWKDNYTLDQADIKKAPDNARLCYYMGNELLISAEEKDLTTKQQLAYEAIGDLKKALSIYPDYSDASRVMGNGYSLLGQSDSAVFYYKRAIALNPIDVEAMNNLNVIYYGTQRYHEAIAVAQNMIAINPDYTEGYNDMGVFYINLKEYDSAIYILDKGMTVDRAFTPFYQNLAFAYKLEGNMDSAKKYGALSGK